MPLSGYMKVSDPGRISTIAVAGQPHRRKKILPTRHDTKNAAQAVYMRDCVEHVSPGKLGGVVPVELFRNEGKLWVSIGTAKCCILCWLIIEPPAGSELPPPQPLPVGNKALKEGNGEETTKEATPRRGGGRPKSKETEKGYRDLVALFKESSEEFTPAELSKLIGVPRTSLNRLLHRLEADGVVEKEIRMHEGQRTSFYASSEKEA